MSQEIIYTSAQKGLRSGSFGFCTVCSTGGMEPNMADFLEGISAYPHPYKPPDPRTNQNPVNFSHIIWTIGGQRFHILSRVCDAGLDYTGRTNLLAHHVALTRREAESAVGGPAWVLSDDDFTVSKWDGQLRTLPGRFPRKDDIPLEVCRHWQQASGDAGHAGVLAESCLDKSGRPVTVIYKPETDVLALVREALSLLPVEKRWGVTFSTFYTKIYSSFECQWRFIFAGSPDAAAARKNPHSFVIDLAGPTPPKRASGGSLVEAARDGHFAIRTAAAPLAASSGVYVPGRTRPPNLPAIPPPNPLGEHDPRLLPPEMIPAAEEAPRTAIRNPFRGNSQKPSAMTIAVAFLGSLCVSLLVILGVMVLRKPPAEKVVANIPGKNVQLTPNVPVANPNKRIKNVEKPPDEGTPPETTVPTNVTPKVAVANAAETSPMPMDPEPTKTVDPPPVKPQYEPLEYIKEKKGRLPLPTRGGGGGLGSAAGASPKPFLAKIYVSSPKDCDLTLLGIEKAFGNALAGNIKLELKDEDETRSWAVIRTPSGSLDTKVETLGTFKLTGEDFSFHWSPNVPAGKTDKLRFCMLKVEVGSESQLCRLAEPVEVEPIKLEKFDKGSSVKLDLPRLDSAMLPDVESLLLQLEPMNLPGRVEQVSADPISPGKSRVLHILGGNEERAILELTVSFSFDKENAKEDGREIRVKGWETYSADKLTLDEALRIGRQLSIKDMTARLKDKKERIKTFEREAIREENDLKKQKPVLEAEIVRLAKLAKTLKDEAAKEAERKWEGYVEQLRRVQESAETARQKVNDAKDLENQVQQTLDLVQEMITKKSTLEFRIYIVVDEQEVELYRSKGFTREF